ncbi:MAG: 6-carboxytetrahydropterin synthase [Pseudomonadota bacterium]
MYAVEVRDHVMLAHSLPGEVFGPAQGVHGATYVVDAAFFAEHLTKDNIVLDIGRATETLAAVLKPLNYANLDDVPAFKSTLTTTEFLCRHIFDALAEAARTGALGPGSESLHAIRITLNESHIARAWYEGRLDGASS